ncbi:hypothetical protein OFO16_15585 [Vibrio natriegens]|uniref:hypothetical protein n=1 Tax=Vibrio natriegens TaxID=691 RepID=UPI0021E8801D|nr:hypothetical protein [Vibrio natriegens]UYI49451.1 hypothetical protein OFO16_15585 [Vibrio natriegens]
MKKYEILCKGNQVAAVELNSAESEANIKTYKCHRFIAQRVEIDSESEEQAIKVFLQKNATPLQVTSSKEVSSKYSIGKKIYSFVEGTGWLLVIIGVLFTIATLAELISTYSSGSTVAVISAIIPCLGLALGGLLLIALAQIMVTTTATAQNSQKIIEQLSNKSE